MGVNIEVAKMPEPITGIIASHKAAIAAGLVLTGVAWEARRRFGLIEVTIHEDEVVFIAWDASGFVMSKFRPADVFRMPADKLAVTIRDNIDAQRSGRAPTPLKRAKKAAVQSKVLLAKHLAKTGSQTPRLPGAVGPAGLLGS